MLFLMLLLCCESICEKLILRLADNLITNNLRRDLINPFTYIIQVLGYEMQMYVCYFQHLIYLYVLIPCLVCI